MYKKLSIIIPCYNEERTVKILLEKIASVSLNYQLQKEIILIDDASTDKTLAVIQDYYAANRDLDLKTLQHPLNRGKGACIKTGIQNASGDLIIVQDADLEYSPSDYNKLLHPICDGFADVVFGSRFMGDGPHRVLFFFHTVGNKFLTLLSNLFTRLNLTDMETGYKMFRSDVLKNLQLTENRFGFEPEITAKISKIKNIRIYEVGIAYYGRTYAEGKKVAWTDGLKAIYCIFKYNLFTGK